MRRLLLLVCALVCLTANATAANAPYTTLTEDNQGRLISTLDGYAPDVAFGAFDGDVLKGAQDLFIDENDTLYIADTGNKRVVACTTEGELLRVYGEKTLKKPSGVCVRFNKLYVADSSRKAIIVFDLQTGDEVARYEKPQEPLYGEGVRFEPLKVQVDASGIMYVICNGNAGGVAMLSPDGAFLGYFGANNTTLGFGQIVKRLLYTEKMLSSLRLNVPNTPSNLTMDARGLLYTATTGSGDTSVKKFSMSGENLLSNLTRLDDNIVDVAVGGQGTLYALNSLGYIYEYTDEGRLLFFFGGEDATGSRDALFKSLSSIAVDSTGCVYVLDSGKNIVQRFTQTKYAQRLHTALTLWQDGLYEQSREPWEEVLRSNSLFDFAYVGLGKAYYKQEQYTDAMRYFRLGGDREGYSDAYWEVRAVWLQKNLMLVVFILIVLRILRSLYKKLRIFGGLRDKMHALNDNGVSRVCRLITGVLRNPAAVFYDVKHSGALSVGGASVLYLLMFAIFAVSKYASAFLFKQVADGKFALGTDAVVFFGLMALFLFSLNLVCSTRQSEARLRDLYCGLPCAMAPYFLIQPVLFALGYALTYNEQFLMSFGSTVMIVFCAVLVIVMVREMQNYSYGDTFRVILLTAFVMLVILLTLVVVVILVAQLYEFIASVIQEVIHYAFG